MGLLVLYSIFFDFGNIWLHIYSKIKEEYNRMLLNHIYFTFLYSGSWVYMFFYSTKFNMWFYIILEMKYGHAMLAICNGKYMCLSEQISVASILTFVFLGN